MEDIFDVIDRILTEAGYKKTVSEQGVIKYEDPKEETVISEGAA